MQDLDLDDLGARLAMRSSRAGVFGDYRVTSTDEVAMSPQLFLPDGSRIANPGLTVHWQSDWATMLVESVTA